MSVPIPCLYCHGADPAGCPWCAGSGVMVLDHVGHDEPPEDDQGCPIGRAA